MPKSCQNVNRLYPRGPVLEHVQNSVHAICACTGTADQMYKIVHICTSAIEQDVIVNLRMCRKQFLLRNTSVAEQKLIFVFGSHSGSTFVHNFGSGSSSCHILPLLKVKTVL